MIAIAAVIAAATAAGIGVHRRLGDRAGRLSRRILTAMLYVLFPPVVFFNLVDLEFTADIGVGIAIAWVAVIVVGLIAHLIATRGLRLDRPQTGTLINAALHPNTGYLGIPVCAAVLGTGAVDQAVVYDILVGAPTLLIGVFAIGAAYGTEAGDDARERARAFVTRNPPLLAAIAGVLAPRALAPDALVDASRVLVFLLLPLGFFALGITLASEGNDKQRRGRMAVPSSGIRARSPDRGNRHPPAALVVALLLRLVVAPSLLLLLTAPLIDLPDAYLILAAMPTGLNGLIVAHAYGLDVPLAGKAIAYGTTIVVVAGVAISLISG